MMTQVPFCTDKGARQACLAPVAYGASTLSHDDHSCKIGVQRPNLQAARQIPYGRAIFTFETPYGTLFALFTP